MRNDLLKRTLSVLLCLVLVLSYLPVSRAKAATADKPLHIVAGSKKADPHSIIWEDFFRSGCDAHGICRCSMDG